MMGSKTTADLLREARDLIADPKCWTQGRLAREADGSSCEPDAPEAVCWCAMGAVRKIDGLFGPVYEAIIATAESRGIYVSDLNDGLDKIDGLSPHQAIIRLFDEAIQRAEAGHAAS